MRNTINHSSNAGGLVRFGKVVVDMLRGGYASAERLIYQRDGLLAMDAIGVLPASHRYLPAGNPGTADQKQFRSLNTVNPRKFFVDGLLSRSQQIQEISGSRFLGQGWSVQEITASRRQRKS